MVKQSKLLNRIVLDIDTNNKSFVSRIIQKIGLCKNLYQLIEKDSLHKGVHIILHCSKECDLCQFVYDDFRHFAYDRNRPKYARNILFDLEIFPDA